MNHGFLSDKTKNTFGAVVEYGCRRGFIIKGPKVRICQCSGEWSGGEPKCIGNDYLIIVIAVVQNFW